MIRKLLATALLALWATGAAAQSTGGIGPLFIGTTAGGTTAYTLTPAEKGFRLVDQWGVRVKINATNTGASTLNVASTGAIAINKQTGAGLAALAASDLIAGNEYDLVYQTSANAFVIVTYVLPSQAGNTVSANISNSPGIPSPTTLPTCLDTAGQHYNYNPASGFSCGTSNSGTYTPPARRIVSGASDTATSADYTGTIFWASGTANAKAQTIPACASGNNGQWIVIVDEQGTAATFNITITPASGTILGGASAALATNKSSGRFECDGPSTNWTASGAYSPPDIAVNVTSMTVTANQWQAGKTFVITAASQTITLPSATTLAVNGNIIIQTSGVTATLTPNVLDGINGGTVNTPVTIPSDSTLLVTTTGANGTGAIVAPLPAPKIMPLTWAEGVNLSANARYIGRVLKPLVISSITCNVQAAAGSASTVHVFATASGTAPASGTQLDSGGGCNANTASNTEQDMGSSGVTTVPANATLWATFSGTGTSGNGGLSIIGR